MKPPIETRSFRDRERAPPADSLLPFPPSVEWEDNDCMPPYSSDIFFLLTNTNYKYLMRFIFLLAGKTKKLLHLRMKTKELMVCIT